MRGSVLIFAVTIKKRANATLKSGFWGWPSEGASIAFSKGFDPEELSMAIRKGPLLRGRATSKGPDSEGALDGDARRL